MSSNGDLTGESSESLIPTALLSLEISSSTTPLKKSSSGISIVQGSRQGGFDLFWKMKIVMFFNTPLQMRVLSRDKRGDQKSESVLTVIGEDTGEARRTPTVMHVTPRDPSHGVDLFRDQTEQMSRKDEVRLGI